MSPPRTARERGRRRARAGRRRRSRHGRHVQTVQRGRRGRGALLLCVALAALCVGAGWLGAAGWAASGLFDPLEPSLSGWLSSLASDLCGPCIAMLAIGTALLLVASRCTRGGAARAIAACALAGVLPMLVLVSAVLGPARAPRVAGGGGAEGGGGGVPLRVMAINVLASNADGAAPIDAMLSADADVIMINESSRAMLDAIAGDSRFTRAYPHDQLVDRAGPGFRFLASRYPLLSGDAGFGFAWPEARDALGYHGQRVARVQSPQGPVIVAGVQFRSPRSPERWAAGNAQVLDMIAGLGLLRDRVRLPLVVVGDFNASPTGMRSARLESGLGLARAKPALVPRGTYPAGWPWPLSIAIDGVLVSEGVGVRSWRTLTVPGSDHEAVVVEVVLPGVPSPTASGSREPSAGEAGG